MFGIGGTEIIVILIVALIAVGPDRLPEAARSIGKGIRDLKRSTRDIQDTIENDEHIGGAIRDIKSALRGEDPPPPRPRPVDAALAVASPKDSGQLNEGGSAYDPAMDAPSAAQSIGPAIPVEEPETASVRLPDVAGEVAAHHTDSKDTELAAMIKPAAGTAPRQVAAPAPAARDEEEDG